MPFGLASATKCLARITKPICALLAKKGIRHSLYIDDGKINAPPHLIEKHLKFTLETLKNAGFKIAENKTDTVKSAAAKKEYLGFIIDAENMEVRASEEKLEATRAAIKQMLQAETVTAKQAASAIGKALALELALGPVVQLQARAAQYELSERIEETESWTSKLRLSAQARSDLDCLADNIREWNGHVIPHLSTATPLTCILGDSAFVKGVWYGKRPGHVIAGDASNKASCSYGVDNMKNFFLQKKFTVEESEKSSGYRELLTVKHALEKRVAHFEKIKGGTVLWLTDSANMVTFLTKGSTKPDVQVVIREVCRRMRELKVTIVPVHISREDYRIQIADEGTRYFDPDDWSVDAKSFQRFTTGKQIELDVFAHTSNRRAERFFSYGKCPHSAGTDAFAQEWDTKGWAWVCPPTNLIVDTVKKILESRMKAILVVPCWQTATFWPYICPDGEHLQVQAVKLTMARPYIVRGKFCENKLLQGYTSFEFMVIEFVTDGSGYAAKSGPIKVVRQVDYP